MFPKPQGQTWQDCPVRVAVESPGHLQGDPHVGRDLNLSCPRAGMEGHNMPALEQVPNVSGSEL